MATTNCCICNEELGRFSQKGRLSESHPDLVVCAACNSHLSRLKGAVCDESNVGVYKAQSNSEAYLSRHVFKDGFDESIRQVVLSEAINPEFGDRIKRWSEKSKSDANKRDEGMRRYALAKDAVMMTTAIGFEGYKIDEYHGVYTGDCVIGTGIPTEVKAALSDLAGEESRSLTKKLRLAKESAKDELIKQCLIAGGNAVIGVSFEIYPYGSMLGVTAYGTSVTIEKIE